MFDFGIGGSEILVIAVVALIVIGPKDLPKVLRAIGKTLASMRRMAGEFQHQLDDAMKDTGLNEIRQEVASLKSMASNEINKQADLFTKAQAEAEAEMKKVMADEKPVMPAVVAPASVPAEAAPEAAPEAKPEALAEAAAAPAPEPRKDGA